MRSGFGQVGLAGSVILGLCVTAALYLISGPLVMLLAAAFRGPQDALPFEPGTHWTFANLAAIFSDRALLAVIPNTVVFVLGSVVLAVTGAERNAALPDVPTIAESGLPGYECSLWQAIVAPAATPGTIVARLNREVTAVLEDPEVRAAFAKQGVEPDPGFVQTVLQRVYREAGIVLLAGEALFLRRRNDATIGDERRRAVVIERREAEDVHAAAAGQNSV